MFTDSVGAASSSNNTNGGSSSAKQAATAASDFHSFLTLLTAQLRNQDPLSPLDSTQFVEQLASFSSVEQQIETNKLLESLNAKISGTGLDAAASWIGMEVETKSGAAAYNGEPLTFKVPGGLGPVEAVVTDRTGNIVYSENIADSNGGEFTWNGKNSAGADAPLGAYTVSIKYADGDGVVQSATPIAVAEIVEARIVDSEVKLVLSNGAIVESDAIQAVRRKQAEEQPATAS